MPKSAKDVLTVFATEIEKLKHSFIKGVYITGSVPFNDFYPNKSDIDFVILCTHFPEKDILEQLKLLHKRIQKEFKRPKLSGVYLTTECLKISRAGTVKVPSVFEGTMKYQNWGDGLTAITLKELKTTALTLFGAPAHTLPIEIDDDELFAVLFKNINSYWRNWASKHASLYYRFILLVLLPWLTEWSVLGIARQLYTLQTGKITSKLQAGYYALDVVPIKHHPIIQQAIAIRKSNYTLFRIKPSLKRAHQTLQCMNTTINEFNRIYSNKNS